MKLIIDWNTIVNAGISDISHGRRFNYVSNDELFDRFVLWNTSSTIGASNIVHMPSSMLASPVVSTFACLQKVKVILVFQEKTQHITISAINNDVQYWYRWFFFAITQHCDWFTGNENKKQPASKQNHSVVIDRHQNYNGCNTFFKR